MNGRLFLRLLTGCVTLACSAVVAGAEAEASAPFMACLDSNNAPFSSSAEPGKGIDVAVATAIAAHLGRPLRVVWVDVPNRGGLAKAFRNSLGAGACEAYFNVPRARDMAGILNELKLTSTQPYLTVGYLYVAAAGQTAPTTQRIKQAARIGAVTATPADLYLHAQQLKRYPYPNHAALVQALGKREVEMALVWSPAWALSKTEGHVETSALVSDPSLRVNLSIVVRQAQVEARDRLNQAIATLAEQGVLTRIANDHDLVVGDQP